MQMIFLPMTDRYINTYLDSSYYCQQGSRHWGQTTAAELLLAWSAAEAALLRTWLEDVRALMASGLQRR